MNAVEYRFTFGGTYVRLTDEPDGKYRTKITDVRQQPITDPAEIERVTKLALEEIGRARRHLWHEVLGKP